jgi:hypothetical protein
MDLCLLFESITDSQLMKRINLIIKADKSRCGFIRLIVIISCDAGLSNGFKKGMQKGA